MRQIIEGVLFDTERAAEISKDWEGYANDFHHWCETLYLTPRGRWFLACKGGAMSRHALKSVDGWTGSSYIKPIAPSEALAWLEKAGDLGAALAHFGTQIEEA